MPYCQAIGKHLESGEEMSLMNGRYGLYIKCGKISAPLPKVIAKAMHRACCKVDIKSMLEDKICSALIGWQRFEKSASFASK